MPTVQAFALLVALPVAAALVQPRSLANACSFTNEPTIPYYWDPECPDDGTSLGCMADGINPQCRFCGEGPYSEVFCPTQWCQFDNEPNLPYYWDARCTMGSIGCLADGKNIHCRFCGEFPYNGSVHCPDNKHTQAPAHGCQFETEPTTPYFYDVTCEVGMLGCLADNKDIGCRFCGAGAYAEVTCPASLCALTPEMGQQHRHYWEPQCWGGLPSLVLGCLADGIHKECRYCGDGAYSGIPCPASASPAH